MESDFLCPDTGLHSRLLPLWEKPSAGILLLWQTKIKALHLLDILHLSSLIRESVKSFSLWSDFTFLLCTFSHLHAYFVVGPLSPERLPSYDEKSDPFLFQSLFSPLISVFVVLTDSVSLYAFWCIFTPYMEIVVNLNLILEFFFFYCFCHTQKNGQTNYPVD